MHLGVGGELMKEEKFPTCSETSHRHSQRRASEPQGNIATGAWKEKAEFTAYKIIAKQHFLAKELVYMPTIVSGCSVLRLRLWRSNPRKRTGVGCHEDTPEGASTTQLRSPQKSLGLPERQEIIYLRML